MKKAILVLIAVLMLTSLCACQVEPERKPSVDEIIHLEVQARAFVKVYFTYGDVKSVRATVTNREHVGDGKYDVNGKVTIIDNYGDQYNARFDATVRIDADGESDCIYFDMETPRR